MKITIGDERIGHSDMNIHGQDVTVRECYEPIVVVTPAGNFGICQRDGGIEVVKDGELVFAKYEEVKREDCKAVD